MANETRHVKQSFEERCKDELGAETNIHYAGLDFDTSSVTEWIEPRDLGYSPIGSSGVQPGTRRELWGFSFDIYVRVGLAGETTHRPYEIADLIRGAFDWIDLSVLDWTGDHAQEAMVYFSRGDFTPVLETKQGQYVLHQVNVSYQGVLWA